MTSTISSKLKQCLSIFLWTLKTNRGVIIVYLSILGFFAVTNFALSAASGVLVLYGFMAVETFLTAMIIGLIVSIRSFSYLHSKRQTDLVGSLPVSRRTMFFSRMISAIVISGVPLLTVNLILNLVFGFNYSGMLIDSDTVSLGFLRTTVILISCIALFGLLSICCGKTSDKIISFAGINLAAPFAFWALTIIPSMMLFGYSVEVNPTLIVSLSPAFSFISFNGIYWLIFTAVCIILSFFLIKNRKAESAQSHFAYKLPLVAIKVLVSFSAGIVTAFVMLAVSSASGGMDSVMFWTGMIIGSFIAHLIVQFIFNHGTKGFLKGLIPYGAMLLCFALFFIVLGTGFFGYESYVPNVDEIKSVNFTGGAPCYIDGVNITAREVTDKKIIKEAVEAHKQALRNTDNYKKQSMLSRSSLSFADEDSEIYSYVLSDEDTTYNITYTLNDGRKVTREYPNYFDDGKVSAATIDFMRTKEYKENASPAFICDEKYLVGVDFDDMDDGMTSYTVDKPGAAEKCRKILKTFKKEYDKYGYRSESSDYTLYFSYGKMNKSAESILDIKITETVSVPKNFKKTIKLLESNQKTIKIVEDAEDTYPER